MGLKRVVWGMVGVGKCVAIAQSSSMNQGSTPSQIYFALNFIFVIFVIVYKVILLQTKKIQKFNMHNLSTYISSMSSKLNV